MFSFVHFNRKYLPDVVVVVVVVVVVEMVVVVVFVVVLVVVKNLGRGRRKYRQVEFHLTTGY
jgi:hypothetical protein